MRVGDLQQIMLQTDTVGKVQQQGSHSAEVDQSKLASQHLIKEKEKEKQVLTAEDTVFIKDRDARQSQQQTQSEDDAEGELESGDDGGRSGPKTVSPLLQTGKHIDIKV